MSWRLENKEIRGSTGVGFTLYLIYLHREQRPFNRLDADAIYSKNLFQRKRIESRERPNWFVLLQAMYFKVASDHF